MTVKQLIQAVGFEDQPSGWLVRHSSRPDGRATSQRQVVHTGQRALMAPAALNNYLFVGNAPILRFFPRDTGWSADLIAAKLQFWWLVRSEEPDPAGADSLRLRLVRCNSLGECSVSRYGLVDMTVRCATRTGPQSWQFGTADVTRDMRKATATPTTDDSRSPSRTMTRSQRRSTSTTLRCSFAPDPRPPGGLPCPAL